MQLLSTRISVHIMFRLSSIEILLVIVMKIHFSLQSVTNFYEESNQKDSYFQNLELIFKKHLDPEEILFCIDCNDIINYIPRNIAVVLYSSNGKKIIGFPNKRYAYTAIILNLSTGSPDIIQRLEQFPGWNPSAKFMIIYNEKKDIFKQLFSKYIINAVVLSTENNSTIKAKTYYPFKDGLLHPKSIESSTLSIFSKGNNVNENVPFFPDKYPLFWQKAVVEVAPVFVPPYLMCPTCKRLKGLEILLLRDIGKRIGVTFKYPNDVYQNWGEKNEKEEYNHALGALQAHKFDMSCGAFFPNVPEIFEFDMAYPYMEDDLVLVVPTADVENPLETALKIFRLWTWIIIIVCQIIIPLIFWFISGTESNRDLSATLLMFFGIICKVPFIKPILSRSEKVLLIFWIIYCLLTDTYFESHLQGVFNSLHRKYQIETLEEAENTNNSIYVHEKLLKMFVNKDMDFDNYLQKNHIEINNHFEALNASVNEKECGIVLYRFATYHISGEFVDKKHGTSELHILREKIMNFPITSYFFRGFPLFKKIDAHLQMTRSNGYIAFLYNYAYHRNMIRYGKNQVTWQFRPLNIVEMKYLFLVLMTGLIFAKIIFIFEIFWHKYLSF